MLSTAVSYNQEVQMEFKFLRASEDDIDSVVNSTKAVITFFEKKLTADEAERRILSAYHRIKASIHQYTVIKLLGRKIGHFCFRERDGVMIIEDLWVSDSYRGMGAGTRALEKCISETELPIRAVVHARNYFALSLFRNNGFQMTERTSDDHCILEYPNTVPFNRDDHACYDPLTDYASGKGK